VAYNFHFGKHAVRGNWIMALGDSSGFSWPFPTAHDAESMLSVCMEKQLDWCKLYCPGREGDHNPVHDKVEVDLKSTFSQMLDKHRGR
jgi:hypothetical protein